MPFACTLHLALVFLSLTAVKENTLPAGGQGVLPSVSAVGF